MTLFFQLEVSSFTPFICVLHLLPITFTLTSLILSLYTEIATLQEANMAFLPYESKVFTLDFPECFELLYTSGSRNHQGMVERIADQLATVCAMLGEYPAVRYRT